MKKLLFLFFLLNAGILHAQNAPDTLKKEAAQSEC